MKLRLDGDVTTDGDTIYVDGQNLASILRAAYPTMYQPNSQETHGALTIELRQALRA